MSDIYDRPPPQTALALGSPSHERSIASDLDAPTIASILREAEYGKPQRLWELYRDILISDAHIQSQLSMRKLALLGDPISVIPWDQDNPADVRAAGLVERYIVSHPDFQRACAHLLDSVLWPVSVIEVIYEPADIGDLRYTIAQFRPIAHRHLVFEGDQLLICLDPSDPGSGVLPVALPHFAVHRNYLLSMPDRLGGPMRSMVWWWWLATLARTWWARYLERFGAPFLVGKYPPGDDAAKEVLQSAFSYATRLGGLVVTEGCQVEIKEAMSGLDIFEKFLSVARREISRLLVGQTLSSEVQPTGLGSGTAKLHALVRRDLRIYDAQSLATTLRDQIVTPWLKFNGISANPPTIIWSEDSSEQAQAVGDLLARLSAAGLEPTDDALYTLSERLGFAVRRKQNQSLLPFAPAKEAGADFFRGRWAID